MEATELVYLTMHHESYDDLKPVSYTHLETYEEDGIQFMADQDRLLTAQDYTLTYSGNVAGGKVSVAPGGRALVTVQVDLTEEGQHNLAAFPNGIYVEGFITLEADVYKRQLQMLCAWCGEPPNLCRWS